ncbi:hypothetical protein JVT61DRAFT_10346 [Boletus reticuloceps]|uniref:Uncharacterized protein n=1 Tax=Boletus reticuloceps TaxID=495285 RepID=A0A8I3AC05_9AGAM|nr:hypothetical protein JVT61DRAFT_10346 [Boletus reticuloceps]
MVTMWLMMKGAKGVVYMVRECFDHAFAQHLGGLSHVNELFANQRSHRWRAAMHDYMQEVVTELLKVIATIVMIDLPEDSNEHCVLQSLKWAIAKLKVRWFLLMIYELEKVYALVLMMLHSVFNHMVKHLAVISDALQEGYRAFQNPPEMRDSTPAMTYANTPQFCRWWEPLIDMVPVIGKYWKLGSLSTAMVRAILCHCDICDNHREVCVHQSYMSSGMTMHHSSTCNSNNCRITRSPLALRYIFGVDSEGCNTKELQLARVATMLGIMTRKTTITATTKEKGKKKSNEQKNVGGKAKRHKPDDDASDDEDKGDHDTGSGNGDGHGKFVKGHDSAWVDSDEVGEDGDEEDDNKAREKQARICHENTMKQQRALVAKNQEWSEIYTMLTGSKNDGCHKTTPILNFDRSPPNFLTSWKKLSCVSKGRNTSPMRRLSLIDWTTWEWKDVATQSFL